MKPRTYDTPAAFKRDDPAAEGRADPVGDRTDLRFARSVGEPASSHCRREEPLRIEELRRLLGSPK